MSKSRIIHSNDLQEDYKRYGDKKLMPPYQKWYRLARSANNKLFRLLCIYMLRVTRKKYLTELSFHTLIGPGLYIGHPYCVVINPDSVIGSNVNLSKGVTIGQENRGLRKGVPTIGDRVWIGANATVVGKINIGTDVLIAPNSFVNCDVPDHSIVFGNPCIIKHNDHATQGYL